eukprot:102083_1
MLKLRLNSSVQVLQQQDVIYKAKPEPQATCALLTMIISAVLFSMMGALIVYGHKLGYGSGQMLMVRGVVQTIVTLIIMLCNNDCNTKIIQDDNVKSAMMWLILRGIFGATAGVLYFYSITLIDLGDAITTFSIYPITTAFFAYFVLSEPIELSHIFALILAICGVVMISQPSFIFQQANQQHISAYICSIVAAMFAGCSFISMRKSKNTSSNALVLSYSIFCIIEGYLSSFFMQKFYISSNILNWKHYTTLCGIGIIGYIANVSMTYSAQRIEAGISSFIRSSDIIYSYLWGLLLFHQKPTSITVIGGLIILCAIVVICYLKYRKEKANKMILTEEEILLRRNSMIKSTF